MTNPLNMTTAMIATTMRDSYFDLDSRAKIDAYTSEAPIELNAPLRDRLIEALTFDIDDLLHNANLTDLIPAADSLNDDDFDDMSDAIDDDAIAALADLLLAAI